MIKEKYINWIGLFLILVALIISLLRIFNITSKYYDLIFFIVLFLYLIIIIRRIKIKGIR